MTLVDWSILCIYLILTVIIGLFLTAKNQNEVDFFLAGRRLTGWLAGASMAATTFSIDTPLYVAGLVGTRGLSGNWEWWSFGIAHVAMTVVFAPMWRRSEVMTDAAFTELRYGGKPAAWLRGIKAFLLALPINCIGIGYAFLAMRKVAEALDIVNGQKAFGLFSDTSLLLITVAFFILFYTVLGGFWAVVVNDLMQLLLALFGALAVAIAVLHATGGMHNLLISLEKLDRPELLALFPWEMKSDGFQWLEAAEISFTSFIAFLALQWWSFRRSDGGGEFIQRLLATRNEKESELAGWVFLVINYLLRSWLWILVALGALVLLPSQNDWEMSYPILAMRYLPPVVLGLVVVSLVAAFMSTVSTSVNWGASYLTHDLYKRFFRPSAGRMELVFFGQLSSLFLLVIGVLMALISDSIGSVFRLAIAIGTGPGVVLVLRWFWWRINAAAEISAMICGFLIGFTTSLVPLFRIEDYGQKLIFNTLITGIFWMLVMFLTEPESDEVLEKFVRKVAPPGPGWKAWRERFGVSSKTTLKFLLNKFLLSLGLLYGALLGSGSFLLHQALNGWIFLGLAVFCFMALRKQSLQNIALNC